MRPLIVGAGVLVAALTVTAGAQAGTLSRESGVLTYTAGPGEVNDLEMRWPRVPPFCAIEGSCVRVTDAGAPVGFGALDAGDVGCALNPTGIECASNAARADVGDGDDRARVSVVTTATLVGGPGDDDLAARGEAGAAYVHGGPGDDIVEADGEGGLADGGAGDDHVAAFWNVLIARGGAGDDEIRFSSQFEDGTVDGGAGDDEITVFAFRAGSVTAGNGNDHVVIQAFDHHGGSGWNVDAGNGADMVQAGPGHDTVDTGNGADAIDVAGGRADTVSCGKGHDTVRADAEDAIADDCEVVELI